VKFFRLITLGHVHRNQKGSKVLLTFSAADDRPLPLLQQNPYVSSCTNACTCMHVHACACTRCSFLRLQGNLVYVLFIDSVLKITVMVTGVRVRLRVALLLKFITDNSENQRRVFV